MALSTLGAVKRHLGIAQTTTTLDDFLTQLLSAVEAAFARLIDRRLELQDYSDYFSGNNTRIIRLTEYPVDEVSEVRMDLRGGWGQIPDSFGSTTVLTVGVDYVLVKDGRDGTAEFGRLERLNGVWPGRWRYQQGLLTPVMRPSSGTILVSYSAGYDPIPDDVQLCLWQVCALLREERSRGRPIGSERFEDYMVTLLEQRAAELMSRPGSIQATVARYRRLTRRGEVLG